jgi:uncharacterized protein YndB with AHSA1/START domain
MNTKTLESKPQFVYVTYIRTTPEKLWKALTDGDWSVKYWFGFRIQTDWKVGSPISILASKHIELEGVSAEECEGVTGKVLAYEPLKKLSYTFGSNGDKPEIKAKRQGASIVTYELKPMGPMVRLRLIHENLLPEDIAADPDRWQGVNNGWSAILSSLKSLLETGKEIDFGV